MSKGIEIVVCCAHGDREAIEGATAPLVEDGNTLHFVDGVVEDPKCLVAVIEGLQGEGLYVLCRSQGLGRASIEALREILLAAEIPFSRTLTVAATRPTLVADRIRGSIGRVTKDARATAARRLAGPRPDTAAHSVSPTSPAPRQDSVVAPLPSSSSVALHKLAPDEAPAPTSQEPTGAPTDLASESLVASISDLDLSDLDSGDTNITVQPLARPTPTPPSPASARATHDTVRACAASGNAMGPDSVHDPLASASISVPPGLAEPRPASPPPPNASPSLSAARPAPTSVDRGVGHAAPPTVQRTGAVSRAPWIAAGVGVTGLLALAAVWVSSRAPVSAPTASTPQDRAAEKAAGEPPGSASGASSVPGSDPARRSADNDNDNDGDNDRGAEITFDDTPTAVLAAIQRRNVRALDILLVQAKATSTRAWEPSRAYCQTLTVDGLEGWRLPVLGELRSLGAAKMLEPKAVYWSATAADTFGDAHLAWQPRRGRVVDSLERAQALCVRGDRPSS